MKVDEFVATETHVVKRFVTEIAVMGTILALGYMQAKLSSA